MSRTSKRAKQNKIRRVVIDILNVIARTSSEIQLKRMGEEEAETLQIAGAQKVIRVYGAKLVFEALPFFASELKTFMIKNEGKIPVHRKVGDKLVRVSVPMVWTGVYHYFETSWPDQWDRIRSKSGI